MTVACSILSLLRLHRRQRFRSPLKPTPLRRYSRHRQRRTRAAAARPIPSATRSSSRSRPATKRPSNGDTKETKALTADLEKWTKEQPTNYLLQAYLGSVYTLDSRDAWPGPGKLTYLKNGGKVLDAAVAAAPDNPAVRFVRAIDYYELPSIFGKRQTARDDFQILLKQIDGDAPDALRPQHRDAAGHLLLRGPELQAARRNIRRPRTPGSAACKLDAALRARRQRCRPSWRKMK